jgi:hypothetical protein
MGDPFLEERWNRPETRPGTVPAQFVMLLLEINDPARVCNIEEFFP